MSSSDPNDQANRAETPSPLPTEPPEDDAGENREAADTSEQAGEGTAPAGRPQRRQILIGTQRDPAAYRARRTRDWAPLPEPDEEAAAEDRAPVPAESPSASPSAAT